MPAETATVTVPRAGSKLQGVTGYHWVVFFLAAGGWLFDCMGQRIFVLAREPAMRELLGASRDADVTYWGTVATFILMIGWATGGLIFGMMSDRYGRVKAMVATLLAYSIFSGLSGLAHTKMEFMVYRFLCGLGIGGMFGAATTLLAESVPAGFRTFALGMMQALSATGNMLASALSLRITPGVENFWGRWSGWQVLFFVGVTPAVLAIPMLILLKEPESWKKAKADAASGRGKKVGSIADLFGHPRWRRNTLVGVCLGLAGMVGLWGIAFFSPELITTAFKNRPLQQEEILKPSVLAISLKAAPNSAVAHLKQQLSPEAVKSIQEGDAGSNKDILLPELNRLIQTGNLYDEQAFNSVNLKKGTLKLARLVSKKGEKQAEKEDIIFLNRQLVEQTFPGAIAELQKKIDETKGRGTLFQDVGSLLGMLSFTFFAVRFNRRTAFLGAFLYCLAIVSFVFYSLRTETDVYWMLPMMGFGTLSCFAGYSIYFPELFPTRLRGTGVGFCYNTVRYLAAPFPLLLGKLNQFMPFRTVAVLMASIYVVGMIALIWAPETRGQPLPED